MKLLNNVFPNWVTGGGIFEALGELDVPWSSSVNSKLDFIYHGNFSGNKIISPLVNTILGEDTSLSDTKRTQLASIIYALNSDIWEKEFATLSLTYDPIENYSMTETMTDDTTVTEYGGTSTRTDNLSHLKTGTETVSPNITNTRTDDLTQTDTKNLTDTTTDDLTQTDTKNLTDTITDDLTQTDTKNLTDTITDNLTQTDTKNLTDTTTNTTYGFNSSTAVPTSTSTVTNTGTDTITNTGTKTTTNTGTDTVTNTGTKTVEYTGTDTTRNTGTETTTSTGTDTTTYNTTDSNTGTETTVKGGDDTQTRNYTLTRSGNIGVTTSQQMLSAEREVQLWNFFYEVVFPSVDKILTIQVY